MIPEFDSFLEPLLRSAGRVIKESAAKRVTVHHIEGGHFFVKRYRHAAFAWRPLKFFFKASQAAQEWKLAATLESRGVPVVRHMALGEQRSLRGLLESVLVTEAFPGVPLDEAPGLDSERIVGFVDLLSCAGIMHRDLHPANILVEPASGAIRLVDLHGIEVKEQGSDADRDEMLALLRMTFPFPVTPSVARRSLVLRKKALCNRSYRCLKENRDFSQRVFGSRRWHVRQGFLSSSVETILHDPDAILGRARLLKDGRSSTVGAIGGFVVKRYNFRRWTRPLKDLMRESRALAAFRKAYHLELAGIPTARPIAAANERRGGLVRRGFLVMEEIQGATELGAWSGDKRHACRAVAGLIARLHEEGFSHRDLKESNILFDANGVAHLIDLEGLRFENDVPSGTAAENLRRLARGVSTLGRLDRQTVLLFCLRYCRARSLRPRQLFPRP